MGITVFPLLPLSRYGHVGLIYQSVIEQYKTDVPIDRIKVVLAFSKGDADKPVILIAAVIFQKCSRPISGIRIDHISAMRKKMLNQFDATVILALWFIAVDLLNSGKLQTFIDLAVLRIGIFGKKGGQDFHHGVTGKSVIVFSTGQAQNTTEQAPIRTHCSITPQPAFAFVAVNDYLCITTLPPTKDERT